jgi:hypothetical protein
LAGSAFSPKLKPVGLAAVSFEDFSPKRKLGLAGSLIVEAFPKAKPDKPSNFSHKNLVKTFKLRF